MIPAMVPKTPDGILVTPSMQELLQHLTSPPYTRVCFFGMGGIGPFT
eukprot:COSAG01_NODE_5877_length_3973_cov_2.627001_7_plen_47_part_00